MIVYQTTHLRVFNGEGYDKEKLLLLKYFNNYSIKQWLKTIIQIQGTLKIKFNINEFILFFILTYLPLINIKILSNLKNKYLIGFFRQKLLNIYLLKIFKIFFQDDLCLKIFFEYNFANGNFSGKGYKSLKNREFSSFLNQNFMPGRFKGILNTDTRLKLYKNEYLRPVKNLYNKIENLNNKNIFIVGQVYDFYRGSITPFYKAKYSWFASTGLKSDIECNDLEVSTIVKIKPLVYLYEDPYKDIVFKLRNFRSKITTQVKKKTRHIFFYNAHNFLGLQRFVSEFQTSFNYKQNNNYTLNKNFIIFFFNSSFQMNKIFSKKFSNNFSRVKGFMHNIFNFSYSNTINLNFRKLIFFIFQSIKTNFDYYNFIQEELTIIIKSTEVTYRSLIIFINLQKHYFSTLVSLIKNFFKQHLVCNFKLRKITPKVTKFNNSFKILTSFISIYSMYQKFLLNMNKFFNRRELLTLFFEIFLYSKRKKILKKKLYEDLLLEEETELQIELLKKRRWFNMYKNFFFYIYFFLDLKLNLEKFILPMISYNYILLEQDLFKSFENLQIKWHFCGYLPLKDFYFYFLEFIENLFLICCNFFYFSKIFLKNKLNYRFFLFNIYTYLFNKKQLDSENFLLSNVGEVSGSFLGKWFYYRQIHHFSDSVTDSYYHQRKPSRALGFNLLESNLYSLNRYSVTRSNLNYINLKLDLFFRSNIARKAGNNKSLNINKLLAKQSNLIHRMYLKMYKLRSFFWARNLTKIVDNSLKSLVNFNLPGLPKKMYQFFGYRELERNFQGRLSKKKFSLTYNSKLGNSFLVENNNSFSQTFLLLYNNKNNFINSNSYFYNWLK